MALTKERSMTEKNRAAHQRNGRESRGAATPAGKEDRCFRQFARLGNFMVKTQTHAEKRAENEGASGYVDENTQAVPTAPDGMPESEVRGPESGVKSAAAETRCSKLETSPIDNRQSKIDNEVSGVGGNASSVSSRSNTLGKMSGARGKVTRLETCTPAVGGLSGENTGMDLNMSGRR